MDGGAWWAAIYGVAQSRTRLSDFTFTFHFHALEKEMATHSSVLAWRIPGTGEPGGLPSMGLHRVGHDWSGLAAAATHTAHLPPSATSAASTTFSHVQSFSELPLSNASVGILFLCLHPTILPFRLGEVCVCVLVAQLHPTLLRPLGL